MTAEQRTLTPTERSRAIQLAIVNLDWLTDEYRTFDAAIEILRDTRTQATIAAGSTSGDGRHAVGSHSDPTGSSVIGQLAATEKDNDQRDTLFEAARRLSTMLRKDVADIAETSDFIRATITRALHDCEPPTHPPSMAQAKADLGWCNTIGALGYRLGAAVRMLTITEVAELDDALERITQRTNALRAKVTKVLYRATRPEEPPKAKTKEPEWCISCARIKDHCEPIALHPNGRVKYATLCRMCGDFKGHYGRIPPIGVVEARRDGKSITNKLIEVALADEAQRSRKVRGA